MKTLGLSDSHFAWLSQYFVGVSSVSFILFTGLVVYLFLYKYRKCKYDLSIIILLTVYEILFILRLA